MKGFVLDPHLEICAENECERILSETGDYPIDWMGEVAADAQIGWTEDGILDYDSAEDAIVAAADHYIAFVRDQESEEIYK